MSGKCPCLSGRSRKVQTLPGLSQSSGKGRGLPTTFTKVPALLGTFAKFSNLHWIPLSWCIVGNVHALQEGFDMTRCLYFSYNILLYYIDSNAVYLCINAWTITITCCNIVIIAFLIGYHIFGFFTS